MAKQEVLESDGPNGLWEEVLDVAKASHFVSLATFVSWVCLKI